MGNLEANKKANSLFSVENIVGGLTQTSSRRMTFQCRDRDENPISYGRVVLSIERRLTGVATRIARLPVRWLPCQGAQGFENVIDRYWPRATRGMRKVWRCLHRTRVRRHEARIARFSLRVSDAGRRHAWPSLIPASEKHAQLPKSTTRRD
jgi:hypothetical protein